MLEFIHRGHTFLQRNIHCAELCPFVTSETYNCGCESLLILIMFLGYLKNKKLVNEKNNKIKYFLK